jgi:hypothetical protein
MWIARRASAATWRGGFAACPSFSSSAFATLVRALILAVVLPGRSLPDERSSVCSLLTAMRRDIQSAPAASSDRVLMRLVRWRDGGVVIVIIAAMGRDVSWNRCGYEGRLRSPHPFCATHLARFRLSVIRTFGH